MRLISVTVSSFRGIVGPVTVPFTLGLNVVHGPNEVGKSTLAEAIRVGLTLPSRIGGKTRERLVPRTGGTPKVRVRFEQEGVTYEVTKEFGGNRNGTTFLRVEGQRTEQLRDDEAEARLRDVLGVGAANNRGNIEDMGLFPLVWVEQGRSGTEPTTELAGSSRTLLSERLAELGGEVFAGHGAERLFAAVEARYNRYYTPTGSESRSAGAPLAGARAAHEAAAEAHRTLASQLADHESRLARHARLREELERLDAQIPTLEAALEQAVEAEQELARLEAELDGSRRDLQLARKEHEGLRRDLERREELRRSLARAVEQLQALTGELQELEQALTVHREARAELTQAVASAEEERKQAEQQRRRVRAALTVAEAAGRLAELKEKLDQAEGHREELDQILKTLAANGVTPKIVKELQGLQQEAGVARASLEAAAARVEVEALRPVSAHLDGRPLALEAGAVHAARVDAPTELAIADLVRVRIRPGGEDLGHRRDAAKAAESALASRLQDLGLPDVAAAEVEAEARRALDARRAELEGLLKQLQPDALRTAHTAARAEGEKARRTLHELGPSAQALPAEVPELRGAERHADQAVDVANEAERDARRALAVHDAQDARLDAQAQGLRRQLGDAGLARDRARGMLETHVEGHGDDEALGARVSEHAGRVAAHGGAVAELDAKVQARVPDQVRREVTVTRGAVDGARKERTDIKDQLARLEGELGGDQALGLHDRVQRAASTLREAEVALEAELKRAQAAKLLYETLRDCRADAQQRHLAPLVQEVHRLLRVLFPGAKVQVGEQLDSLELDRGAVEGQHPFDELSGGAREQLGVLVRLALARLIAGGGALPILLDDALVATDEARFKRMRKVLDAASEDLQVIFLTCHWERLRGLGLAPKHRVDLELALQAPVDA